MRFAMLAGLIAILSACVYFQVGDSVLSVQGELEAPLGKAVPCELQLWSAENERLLRFTQVSAAFRTSFTVYWKPMRYFLVVSCAEWGEVYRSPEFLGGEPSPRGEPLDLGKIPFPRPLDQSE